MLHRDLDLSELMFLYGSPVLFQNVEFLLGN